MAAHAKDALRSARIAQILNFPFAVATAEAAGAEGLVAGEDGQVLDLVPAGIAAVGAVVADEGAVAEEEQVGVGVEQGAASVASEAVNVPSVAGCGSVRWRLFACGREWRYEPSSKAFPSSKICARQCQRGIAAEVRAERGHTSPQPLHG